MIRFESDYLEGAHPAVLEKLIQTNMEQSPGYGTDMHCARARDMILAACGHPDADVHFLVGGTQTNLTLISAALRPHQGVISADAGHINTHETGAIEATGHKVIALEGIDGKLRAEDVLRCVRGHWSDAAHEHIAQPAMVYISHPTEWGTLYTRAELEALRGVCDELEIPLFLDGARLGYALAANTDVSLADIARLTDAFYIGGTKVGALFGEALVIRNCAIRRDFRYIIKQRGGMLAKGRLLGVQFEALFENGLYERIGNHAIGQAARIRGAFAEIGIKFFVDSPTNQIFPILTARQCEELACEYSYSMIQKLNENSSVVRFCTSWATKVGDVDVLVKRIENLS